MILFPRFFEKVFALKQNDAREYNNRGNVHSLVRDCREAILDYTKAIELNPNYAQAYYNRGTARNKLGENRRALQDFNKART